MCSAIPLFWCKQITDRQQRTSFIFCTVPSSSSPTNHFATANNLDREFGDLARETNRNQMSGNRGRKHLRAGSLRSAPYAVQRKTSANGTSAGTGGRVEGAWKHDLFDKVNKNAAANGAKAIQSNEEIIQFPPRKYTEEEERKLLRNNPLFQRLDPNPDRVIFPPAKGAAPPKAPSRPASITKSFSASSIPTQPASVPSSTRSISIAGAASASVIMSNITPTASVDDIRAILAGLGGGVKELQIVSQSNQSDGGLRVKVTFNKPAEGGKQCIERFDGVVADGRKISVEFENPTQSTSFTPQENVIPAAPKAMRGNQRKTKLRPRAPATSAQGSSRLYSDGMI